MILKEKCNSVACICRLVEKHFFYSFMVIRCFQKEKDLGGVITMNAITVKNLTKKYDKTTAVDHISFEVKEGEFFAFLGENGAGKSTTINMIKQKEMYRYLIIHLEKMMTRFVRT